MGRLVRLWRWLMKPRPLVPPPACPRCGGPVGTGQQLGVSLRFGYVAPSIAEVVRKCGCEAAGRPAVPEWPERARRRRSSW